MTLLFPLALIVTAAGGYDTIFNESVAAFDDGDCARSAVLLEDLVEQGVRDDDVFYNLGNAYYRLAKRGEAIANYERALQLNPQHNDASRNLEKVLSECPRGLARPLPPEWERGLLFWHGALSRETSALLAIGAWLSGWTVLSIRQFRNLRRLIPTGLLLLATGALFGASWYAKSTPQPIAVTIHDKVPVHYGTDDDDKVRFELFVGDRVLIEAEEAGWMRIATIGRERGWIRAEHMARVGPPYHGFGVASTAPEPAR